MKREARLSLSIAASTLLLLAPALVRARSMQTSPAVKATPAQIKGRQEATLMSPAQASLLNEINAQKIKPGYLFRAKLTDTVHLKNGQMLPSGTVLWGKVITDKLQADGKPMLVLQFMRAELKGGKQIPIRAAIMGISAPQYSYLDGASYPTPGSWNGKTLQVDEIGAIAGADLHSKIAGTNSGTLVATKKDHLKLARGSQLALALAAQSKTNQHSATGSGA